MEYNYTFDRNYNHTKDWVETTVKDSTGRVVYFVALKSNNYFLQEIVVYDSEERNRVLFVLAPRAPFLFRFMHITTILVCLLFIVMTSISLNVAIFSLLFSIYLLIMYGPFYEVIIPETGYKIGSVNRYCRLQASAPRVWNIKKWELKKFTSIISQNRFNECANEVVLDSYLLGQNANKFMFYRDAKFEPEDLVFEGESSGPKIACRFNPAYSQFDQRLGIATFIILACQPLSNMD